MYLFFFFNDTATTEIYTLSLHDALPICGAIVQVQSGGCAPVRRWLRVHGMQHREPDVPGDLRGTGRALQGSLRSEEHTSELQSQSNLVCRLLLEKKKKVQIKGVSIELHR